MDGLRRRVVHGVGARRTIGNGDLQEDSDYLELEDDGLRSSDGGSEDEAAPLPSDHPFKGLASKNAKQRATLGYYANEAKREDNQQWATFATNHLFGPPPV